MKNVIQAEVVNCFTEQEHLRSQFVKIIHGKTECDVFGMNTHLLLALIVACITQSINWLALHVQCSVLKCPFTNYLVLMNMHTSTILSLTLYQPMTHRCVMTFVNSP